jgi:hypothetical protein
VVIPERPANCNLGHLGARPGGKTFIPFLVAMKLSSDTTVRYWALQGEEVTGPYTIEGLESLVYLGKISPDSLVCLENQETWASIRETDLVTRLYPRLPSSPTPKAWGRPGETDRHDVKEFKFGEVKFEKVNRPESGPQIEVKEILQAIRQAERDAGQDFIDSGSTKISKRSRDFWFMLIAGNAVLYGSAFYMGNTASWVFAIAGSGLFSWGLIWSMYGVMDRY